MITRSKTRKLELELEFQFDFDDASSAWRANKKSIGNGSFVYVCEHICMNGKKCNQKCVSQTSLCKRHLLYKKK